MIRVLIVDDQPIIRRALTLFLAEEKTVKIIGEAENVNRGIFVAIHSKYDT